MKAQSDRGWAAVLAAAMLVTLAGARVSLAQRILVNFDGADGEYSTASLVQGLDGNLYGTTYYGGADGQGTVFKMTPSGALTTLYSFCSQTGCTDGENPQAGLVLGTDGNFYGTTNYGGVNGGGFHGTIFKVAPTGELTTLYSFCSQTNCTDGSVPTAGLVQGTDGNFYGTTYDGGVDAKGTVFAITPKGALTTIYSFCSQGNCTDGSNPGAGLVQATDGNFYGTTHGGGAYDEGTVYEITPTGELTTLYSFCSQTNCADGAEPYAGGLIQATDGNFYGTTYYGGSYNFGAVFRITPNGMLTTLYSFCSQSGCTEGAYPKGSLVQATGGNFYGTTQAGGTHGDGVIFEISPSGSFGGAVSLDEITGWGPEAGLVQATNGALYGTTYEGGADYVGTVFALGAGLRAFVETLPTSGTVGAAVKILGTNLKGATSVTFNGTPATFTVVLPTEITTTVPSGATMGTVQVTTPSGTLKSNVPFRVIQ